MQWNREREGEEERSKEGDKKTGKESNKGFLLGPVLYILISETLISKTIFAYRVQPTTALPFLEY